MTSDSIGRLSNRRVVITGASRGIGRSIAVALASEGFSLALIARSGEELHDLASSLPGGPHDPITVDVADEDAWKRVQRQLSANGLIHGLITAAGRIGPIGSIDTWTVTEFRRTMDINLIGTILAIKACLPGLRQAEGSVVTLSGGGATGSFPRFDAYSASKVAIVRLTENLAEELKSSRVRINAVAPGFILTSLHDEVVAAGPEVVGRDFFDRTSEAKASGIADDPERVLALVLWLLSDESLGITGRLITAQHDSWSEPSIRNRLVHDPDFSRLRRIDNFFFAPIPSGQRD